MEDNDVRWLIERNHNAYLQYIGLWLACVLGMVNILMSIASKLAVFTTHIVLVFSMYGLLIAGLIFSVYRISNIMKDHIGWVIRLESESLRNEILSQRGKLSRFVVDDEGTLCKRNRNFGIALQIFFALLLLLFAVLPS